MSQATMERRQAYRDTDGLRFLLGGAARRCRGQTPLRVMAERTGRSISTLSRFERGEVVPHRLDDLLHEYAVACGTEPASIWRDALEIQPEVVMVTQLPEGTDVAFSRRDLRSRLMLGALLGFAAGALLVNSPF